jgi:outer membrane immunogenic protein
MRRWLLVAAIFGVVQSAQAADLSDLPILRGAVSEGLTTRQVNWQGYYIGAQAGYGSSDENFTDSTKTMTASMLANTLIEAETGVSQWNLGLGKTSARSTAFGGFVGYNSQWDDVVIGVEMSYLHGKLGGGAAGSQTLYYLLSDKNYHSITSSATSAINIKDMATFRARAGYAYGSFLPYMFGGFALGNADIIRTTYVQDTITKGPASTTPPQFLGARAPWTLELAQHGHLIYGYTAGAGFDMNLVGGLFLRAEWEYVRFTSSVDTNINTVRAGLGYKF